jgi:hypothetical protein
MPKPIIFTPTALARIAALVEQGLSAASIADEIGCTLGSLRVKCSQVGISLKASNVAKRACTGQASVACGLPMLTSPAAEPMEPLTLCLPQSVAERLRQRAALGNVGGAQLAAELLITITRDNLYHAVLDDD